MSRLTKELQEVTSILAHFLSHFILFIILS